MMKPETRRYLTDPGKLLIGGSIIGLALLATCTIIFNP